LRSKKEKEERVESCRVARSMEFERRHEIGRAGQIRWPGTEIRFRYLCTGGGESGLLDAFRMPDSSAGIN